MFWTDLHGQLTRTMILFMFFLDQPADGCYVVVPVVESQLVIMFSTHIRASDGSALKRVISQLQTPNLANILNFAVKEKNAEFSFWI